MKTQEIKFRSSNQNYSILIGRDIIKLLPKKIKIVCPKVRKIALIFDTKVPKNFRKKISQNLKKYDLLIYNLNANEKTKSIDSVNKIISKLLIENFNRSDLIIGVGGGVTGDLAGFVASIYKRGINFINLPTTLLSQVDAAIGGKTGVNSKHGKNLIGSFYQPKLVLSDITFLKSLPKKEIICGYAEILKHAIIFDKNFFEWLKLNTKYILDKDFEKLIYAIKKSCKIKLFFVNKDTNERNQRMILNFGHTFAHAIEVKNNYSKTTTHGEAVLAGIILATKLSVIKNVCNLKILKELISIYQKNNLNYTIKKYSNLKNITNLIPFLKNDKKNNDKKINFILLKKIGKTTQPNKQKISIEELKKNIRNFNQY